MILNGSQIFVEVLAEQGVDTIFGYPGGAVLNLYDELYKNSDRIRHILTAHEQGASHAADGYARATGRTGVVLATSGPGATNLVTGIATAYMDSVPLVAFTGNVATSLLGRDSFQEAYIEGITMPITKHNFTVRKVEDLADTMRAAFRIAQSGRKGPVLVDIPKDVTANSCEFTHKEPELIRTVTRYNEEEVKEAARLINESERPIVYFGGGVRSAAGCQPLRDLLEKTGMPATHTLMAAGVLGYGEPHNLGMLGMHGCYAANKAISEADLVIAVGARFSDRVALNPNKFASKAKIIQIDIDPSELGKNVDVDLALAGDASYILQAILPYVEKTEHKIWMEQIREWQRNDYHPKDSFTELKPHQIINEICEQAGPEAVYVTDVGQHQMWAAQYLHHTKSRGFLTSGGLGTMCMLLLKGLGLSRDYPLPEHRECGDIDIYLYGQSDKGDRVLHEIGAHLYFDVPKHSEYVWDGVLIENHRTILNVRRNRTERELNAVLVRLLEKEGTHGLAPGIQAPRATFNAIFLIRHAAVHFQKEGIVLRHLCDWACFLTRHWDEIDHALFRTAMEDYRMDRFADLMTAAAVEYLGAEVPGPECEAGMLGRFMEEVLTLSPMPDKPLPRLLRKLSGTYRNRWRLREVLRTPVWRYYYDTVRGQWNEKFTVFR